jgi:hypothetical protein
MRCLAVVLFACGCGAHPAPGPSWPKPSDRAIDGGESLAPREARGTTIVETSSDDKSADDAPVIEKPVVKVAEKPAATTTPSVTPGGGAPAGSDDPLTTEEIVIEIDGD